jgi:hypothetical protein
MLVMMFVKNLFYLSRGICRISTMREQKDSVTVKGMPMPTMLLMRLQNKTILEWSDTTISQPIEVWNETLVKGWLKLGGV